jgi:hypothetical protein
MIVIVQYLCYTNTKMLIKQRITIINFCALRQASRSCHTRFQMRGRQVHQRSRTSSPAEIGSCGYVPSAIVHFSTELLALARTLNRSTRGTWRRRTPALIGLRRALAGPRRHGCAPWQDAWWQGIATKRTIAIFLAIKDNSAYFTRYRDWLERSTVVP